MARSATQATPTPRRRYLVTGGAGFIGSHLVDRLVGDGHVVYVLDDLSSGRRENLPPEARLIVGDVADPDVTDAACQDCDGVFHLAAVASVERCQNDWLGSHRTNQSGTIAVFDAARKAGGRQSAVPVVYASSAAVYGMPMTTPIAESSLVSPISAYGADKAASELQALVAWRVHRVPNVGLRFFNVYGSRQDGASPYSGVISIFIDRILRRRSVTVFGDGKQVRDFIHVQDVVTGLVASMNQQRAGAQIFNICTGKPTTINDLLYSLEEIFGRTVERVMSDRRPGDISVSLGDPTAARAMLGFNATWTIERGLDELVRHVVEAGSQVC